MSQTKKERVARQQAEQAARSSYGKLLARLSAVARDIGAAEEALSEAFARALEHWPKKGTPDSPEAWLLTTARNVLRDRYKSAAHKTTVSFQTEQDIEQAVEEMDPEAIPDERLKLLFTCAHPAIDERVRAPMMLQTVLGFEAKQIAAAYLVPASTLAQQLVRAKRKIKNARIPFVVPKREHIPGRLEAVLEAIYGAYAIDWDGVPDTEITQDLSTEALFLADLLVELLPEEPEVLGLAALIGFSYARREGRDTTVFAPLNEQDTSQWNQRRLQRSENLLQRASGLKSIGRFQLEAAIQSTHCARRKTGKTDWAAIAQLYEGLLRTAPTLGAQVAQAAAVGEWQGAEAGLAALDRIEQEKLANFQPAWATRAHLLKVCGNTKAANEAFERAIALSAHSHIRDYLEAQLI